MHILTKNDEKTQFMHFHYTLKNATYNSYFSTEGVTSIEVIEM